MSELKPLPCPFCGGINIINCGLHKYCHSCGAEGPDADNGTDAGLLSAWNRRAHPAQAGQMLTDDEIALVVADCSAPAHRQDDFSFARAIEQAVLAKRVPMKDEQISDGEFTPDAKLMELADKIDHEQNWRHSGIFQRDHLTQDQKDRMLAGVMLRRYADLMAPESWRLFPPKSVVSHSYRAATLEAVIKMAERHGVDAMKEKP